MARRKIVASRKISSFVEGGRWLNNQQSTMMGLEVLVLVEVLVDLVGGRVDEFREE